MSTKNLVNQPRAGRWLILLLALLTTPLGLWAQSYGLTVAGVEVTSENASSITGANITAGTVSFDPQTNTLTLNNVTMSGNVVSSITDLKVKLVGVSTFNIDNSDGDSEYYLFQSTNTTATLTFSADQLGATLQGYGTSTSINYNVNLNYWFDVAYDNQDYWSSTTTQMDNKDYCQVSKPYVIVDGSAINEANKNNPDISGVSFDLTNNKVTLSGFQRENQNYNPYSLIRSNIANLNVDIQGGLNYIYLNAKNNQEVTSRGFIYTGASGQESSLNVTVAEGSKLLLSWSGQTATTNWLQEGFAQTNMALDKTKMQEAGVLAEAGVPYDYQMTISNYTPPVSYGLTVAGVEVTSENASNILSEDQSNAGKVSYDATTNTLTLNGAYLASSNIVTGISLTINLKGHSDVNHIISTNPDATLTFGLAEGADNESSLWTTKNGPSWWQGFSGNPTFNDKLVYLPNADVDYIQKLLPPTLFVEDGLLSFSGLSDSYGSNHFDCYYNIDNVQGDDVAEKKYNPESTSPDAINKPCVVTAHVEFTDVYGNTVKSDNAIGKLFGFERSTVNVPAGSSVDIPAVVPAIAEADGLTISYSPDTPENDPMAYASDGKINAGNQMGTTSIQGMLIGTAEPAYTILNMANDNALGEITVNVVPVAPTVDPEEDGTYSTNTKVTMYSDYFHDSPETATIKYYLNDAQSEQFTYQDEPLSFKGDVTIHAWVEVQDPTNATVHKSEEVVRTYTFKPEPTLAFRLYDYDFDDNYVFSNTYGDQFDEPELKVTGGEFQVTYSSSNTNVATVDSSTGEVTIKSAGKTTITATVEETDEHFGATRSYQLRVTPKIEMTENCILFPGQTISIQVSPEGATVKYGVNEEAKTDYTGAITVNENMLSQHDIHVYVNATYGEGDDQVESETSTRYFVYDRPTVSVPAGTYNDAQHVQITNLPQRDGGYPKVYYYFGNDENNATLYENDAIIDIVESKMLKYYIFEEETLVYKSTPVEAEYVIRTVPEMSYVDSKNEPVEVAEWTIGAENQPLPTLKNELQLQVTYSSTQTDVATVDNNGSVTPVGVGETSITATSTQTDIYQSKETSYLLHVYKMLNHESITIDAIDDQPYTGAPIEPTVTVKDGQTDITNYVNIAYSNNVAVGTSALVTITPKETAAVNYYKGSATTSFNIVNRTLVEGKDVTFASGQSWASYFTNSETLEVPEGIVAYVLTGVNGGTLTVQAISKVPQNIPVLLEKTNNAVTTNDTYEENLLRGTAEATSVTGIEGVVYVLYNGEFVRTKSGTIPAHRAYLVLSSDAGARLSIGFDDEATGIRNLEADGNGNDVWFSLDGQRFDKKPAKKGLYIHNGEKEFVK